MSTDRITTCFLGKLYHYWRGHNAWWGTWVETYPEHAAFGSSLEELTKVIEPQRTQGTVWSIRELPALVVASETHSVVVVEIKTNTPLREYKLPRREHYSLDRFLEHGKVGNMRSFLFQGQIPPARFPFVLHQSESFGGNYLLGWGYMKQEVDLKPLLWVIRSVNLVLQEK